LSAPKGAEDSGASSSPLDPYSDSGFLSRLMVLRQPTLFALLLFFEKNIFSFGKDDTLSHVQGGEAELDVPEPVHHAEAGNTPYNEVRSYFGLHLHLAC
jgi:hypothetical protein